MRIFKNYQRLYLDEVEENHKLWSINEELKAELKGYKRLFSNLDNVMIDTDKLYIVNENSDRSWPNIFFIDVKTENIHYAFPGRISFSTYNLSNIWKAGPGKRIANLEANLHYDDDMGKGTIYISTLDVDRMERRKGHASKLLQLLIAFAKKEDVSKIYGTLYNNTDIGKETLKTFYRSNGFKVGVNGFELNIKE